MGDRLATIDIKTWAEKWGAGLLFPFLSEWAGSPSNTTSPGSRLIYVPSRILI